ncbi:hypothetical protein [Sphingomonas sp. GC_Shp_3]|uniref:hypothetical protein n=1 Tax=Sphingomonas sp. GC_Shp_3 TaxID=2937383 RepID=UPI0022699286|nr:hypothetical protein [Sphingomonas sp. GC_Shp_3]
MTYNNNTNPNEQRQGDTKMVAGLNRERRVAVLETIKADRNRGPVFIQMIAAQTGETSDEAVARYVAEHGPLPEVDDDQVNALVLIPVEPVGEVA